VTLGASTKIGAPCSLYGFKSYLLDTMNHTAAVKHTTLASKTIILIFFKSKQINVLHFQLKAM
jgi:hypothetical protein